MLKKKRLFFLLLSGIMLVLQTTAQDVSSKKTHFQGYSGGMMYHTGYLSGGAVDISSHETVKLQGAPSGIGGLLRFHFGKHFRIGGEGYNSTLHYGKNNSYATLSWGGLLLDSPWAINKFTVFFGGTIGGGSVKNITVVNNRPIRPIEKEAIYRKYSVMIADPFIGMEYAINRRMHLITKIDCLFDMTGKQSDFATGPRVYLGIVFFHGKK